LERLLSTGHLFVPVTLMYSHLECYMSFQSLHLKEKVGKLENLKRKAAEMIQEVGWLPVPEDSYIHYLLSRS